MGVTATVEELENMGELASAKSVSASALRKKAAKDLLKMAPEATKKSAELKLEGQTAMILPFVIALVPAMLHDVIDIVGDGIMLALNSIGGTIAVVGLKTAVASTLLAVINPLYLILGVDNFPAIGWLPLTTLGVIGGMILVIMSLFGSALTSPNKNETQEAQGAA